MEPIDDFFLIANYGLCFWHLFVPQIFLFQNSGCGVGVMDIDL